MPIEKPDATSTPTAVPFVKGRKAIRDENSVQSPIDLEQSRHQYETRSYSKNMERSYESTNRKSPEQSSKRSPRGLSKKKGEGNQSGSNDSAESDQFSDGEGFPSSEGVPSDGDDYQPHTRQHNQQDDGSIATSTYIGYGLLAVFVLMLALFLYNPASEPQPVNLQESFNLLEKEFKRQEADFWLNVKVNIQEIPILNQPRSIIFLYNNKAENTLKRILYQISSIALCSLSECSNEAVIIDGASLNTTEIANDYGKIISKYRDSLETNGVMIVKNLEKVPGGSAQAFHSFCDDYNPIVKKALILFTLKVDTLPDGYAMRFLEKYLLDLWKDIGKDDKFYPLFTRISSTILTVRPE